MDMPSLFVYMSSKFFTSSSYLPSLTLRQMMHVQQLQLSLQLSSSSSFCSLSAITGMEATWMPTLWLQPCCNMEWRRPGDILDAPPVLTADSPWEQTQPATVIPSTSTFLSRQACRFLLSCAFNTAPILHRLTAISNLCIVLTSYMLSSNRWLHIKGKSATLSITQYHRLA